MEHFISLCFIRWWCIGQCTWTVDYQCSWDARGTGSKLFRSHVYNSNELISLMIGFCRLCMCALDLPACTAAQCCASVLIRVYTTANILCFSWLNLLVVGWWFTALMSPCFFAPCSITIFTNSFPTRVTGGLQWRWSAYPVNLDTFGLHCLSHIDLTISSSGNTVGGGYPTK